VARPVVRPEDLGARRGRADDVSWLAALVGARPDQAEPIRGGPASTRERTPTERSGSSERAEVWGFGELVAKIHAAGTDATLLTRRLGVAADPALAGILLAPLAARPEVAPSGRLVSLWPRVEVVDPYDVAAYPWSDLGDLLARLHGTPPAGLPPARPDVRALRALARLPQSAEKTLLSAVLDTVLDTGLQTAPAGSGLSGFSGSNAGAVVHGDVHLGQLGRRAGAWVLLDVDDLATGDPVLDLARPGALWAAGVLPTPDWQALLAGYRARRPTGDPAGIPADPQLWWRLDGPARIALVTVTARALAAPPKEREDEDAIGLLLGACRGIAQPSER
jgi:hypothetical protein